MNCEFARQRLAAYIEHHPPLPPQEREGLKAHLDECATCRAELDALREQVALLRSAGEWARSLGESFELQAPAGARTSPGRLRRAKSRSGRPTRRSSNPGLWLGAAAAAMLVAFFGWRHLAAPDPGTHRGDNPEASAHETQAHLLSGEIIRNGQPVGIMSAGLRYVVSPATDAEIALPASRARARFLKGSQFELPADFASRPGLKLLCGKLRCSSDAPLHVRASWLTAVACGDFALATTAPPPPPAASTTSAANPLTEWLFPSACAAQNTSPSGSAAEGFLLESGWADLTLAGKKIRLTSNQALLGGDGDATQRGTPEELLRDLRRRRNALLAGLLSPIYREVLADYTTRRVRYIAELAAPDASAERKQDLPWRIAMMDELLAAHARRLATLAVEEDPKLRRAQFLSRRIDLLFTLMNSRKSVAPSTTGVGRTAGNAAKGASSPGGTSGEHGNANGGDPK